MWDTVSTKINPGLHGCSGLEALLRIGAYAGSVILAERRVKSVIIRSLCGPGWSLNIETAYKEELERFLKTVPLAVGARAMESVVVESNSLGIFVKVLKERQGFLKVCRSIKYKVKKVKGRCRLAL